MDREELDKIVRLGRAAYQANLAAREAYRAYATAAAAAYSSRALQAAKAAFEGSLNSNNFEQALMERINRDFNITPGQVTSSSYETPTIVQVPPTSSSVSSVPSANHPAMEATIPDIENKTTGEQTEPYKELFASEEEILSKEEMLNKEERLSKEEKRLDLRDSTQRYGRDT